MDRAYLKLKAELSQQKKKDLNEFGGLFNRGHIVEESTRHQSGKDNDRRQQVNGMSVEEGLRSIKDMESVAERYYRDGHVEEAREMMQRAASLKEEIEAFVKATTAVQSSEGNVKREGGLDWANFDFNNPTPEMISTAQEAGLDLTDPRYHYMK